MSPATKSKSKDKKTGKEAQKASPKPALSINGNSSMAASAYNPVLGTFQVLDSFSVASASPLQYGRFRSIDEADVNGVESDSVSNNGSCSGESEDHKEKTTNLPLRQEVIPGSSADNDKREKVRQKNERKHQRQKERRAQELYEKCSTYLMSRKLEALTQQLVVMGISQEHATTALMMNEGKVEESVHWLFDRGEEEIEKQSIQSPGNLKIDITEELARITKMEQQLKCTRQEIERAVVQAEGDLDRAEEVMKGTKSEELSLPVKQDESGNHVTASNGKLIVGISYQNSDAKRSETQPAPLPALQPTRDDKNFNYTKSPPTAEPVSKMIQPMKRPQPKLDWPKPQQSAVSLVDKRWTNTGNVPSASYSLPSSPSPQPSVRVEARYIASGNEFKNPQQQPAIREPVVSMRQRPQVVSTNPVPTSSMSAPPTSWLPAATIEIMKSNGFIQTHNIPSARSPSPNNLNPNQIYQQLQYQNQNRFSSNNHPVDPHGGITRGNGNLWTRNNNTASSPSISAASSLGLFSTVGSTGTSGASSPIDWSSGGSVDYTSIDWSLDQGLSQNTRFNGLWSGSKSSNHMYDANMNRYSLNGSMGGRVNSSIGVSMENVGGGVAVETQTATSQDWTSPFEGKDIFSLSRQYASPSL
ncbi:hypothetical protein EUTSA_v10001930mg [Eutrema salsugineum]|uniref:UBA domain-containing protein n=2 Tax=Eutrema salsugineum TaxID=72664 RepID=V4M1R6_EUTSA|nr:uncharacterized protein LOC18025505 isoform X2 [Eutrema salsugineum]ESQ50059.1 hypothetical protein EUTSA_v10001930mg [Eutrema salsugineum]